MRGRAVGAVVILCGLAFWLMPVSARGQDVAAAPQSGSDEKMTLNLPSVPFGAFLKLLTEKSSLKLVTSPEIAKKQVSCYLPNVTAREALDGVCNAFDLSEYPDPVTGVIAIKDSETGFFPLENVGAKDVQMAVPGLLGNAGKVGYDEKNNFISVHGTRQDIDNVRAAMQRIDATPRNVRIEATIAELSDSAEELIGVRVDPNVSFRGASRLTKLPFKNQYTTVSEDAKAWTYGFISFQDFFIQLQFMEIDGKAKILATPSLTVLSGRTANFQAITHTVIAQKITRQESTLDLVNIEPIYADVGIQLTCLPRVHTDNTITLDIQPSVSTAQKSKFFDQSVDTANRAATTTVLANDGETIAIGGLLRTDMTETVRRVPYLSDIPILGYLFRHRDTSNARTDLVVFITPHLDDKGQMSKVVEKNREWMQPAGLAASQGTK